MAFAFNISWDLGDTYSGLAVSLASALLSIQGTSQMSRGKYDNESHLKCGQSVLENQSFSAWHGLIHRCLGCIGMVDQPPPSLCLANDQQVSIKVHCASDNNSAVSNHNLYRLLHPNSVCTMAVQYISD